jgi:hypothetical protein
VVREIGAVYTLLFIAQTLRGAPSVVMTWKLVLDFLKLILGPRIDAPGRLTQE